MKIKRDKSLILKCSIIVFVLVFLFIKTYSIHFDYKYPMHIDEWQHLALARQIQEKGIAEQNPYFGETKTHFDLEPGFHLFLAGLMTIDKNLILHYQYLPAIFACISAFLLFLLIYRTTKNYWISVFSMIFFAGIKSSVNILGLKFFTPLTMALPLIFLFFIFYIDSINKKDNIKFIISAFILLILFFIHPPSAIILIPAIILELFFNHELIKKRFPFIIATCFIFVSVLGLFAYFLIAKMGGTNIGDFVNIIREIILFREGFTSVEIKYFFPFLYGIVPLIFAFVGIFVKEQYEKKRIWIATSGVCLFLIFIFNNYGFSALAPYQRVLYYAMIGLVPLSAYGLYHSIEFIGKKIHNRKQKDIVIFLLVIIAFALTFIPKYDIVDSKQVYNEKVIYDDDYKAMIWFEKNYGSYNKIITPVFMSSAVYPVTSNYVLSIVPAQLEGGNLEENVEFYDLKTNCSRKEEIFENENAFYVFSKKKLDCIFLTEVYNDKFFIYERKGMITTKTEKNKPNFKLIKSKFGMLIILIEIFIILGYIYFIYAIRKKEKLKNLKGK